MGNTDNEETQNLYNKLVEEVKNQVRKLKELGLNDTEITHLLRSEQPLLKLKVDRNYRIFLGESQAEICMEPLVKAGLLVILSGEIFGNADKYLPLQHLLLI